MNRAKLLITGGRIIDPVQKMDIVGDVLISEGKITYAGNQITPPPDDCDVIDATGQVVCPGFIDLHCHLREPGFEDKETIATGTKAAAKGGFTTICCMPNTEPPLDTRVAVEFVSEKAAAEGVVRVLPVGCITKGRKGMELAEMAELAIAGVAGFSDDGEPVASSRIMRYALEYSQTFGLPVIDHCEDKALSEGGLVNEGWIATRMGLRGIPAAAEENIVARDLALAHFTGSRLHIAHVSTDGSVDLVRKAKDRGIAVTAEVTPHHLALTEDRIMGRDRSTTSGHPSQVKPLLLDAYDTDAKVNPPLRTEKDRKALIQGLKDGVIDAIATDHAPHTWTDKACEFGLAAFGISGLETALAALLFLVHNGELDLLTMVSRLTSGPAAVLGTRYSGLANLLEKSVADITIFDPQAEWLVAGDILVSKGRNTPFKGQSLRGKTTATIVEGNMVYKDKSLQLGKSNQ